MAAPHGKFADAAGRVDQQCKTHGVGGGNYRSSRWHLIEPSGDNRRNLSIPPNRAAESRTKRRTADADQCRGGTGQHGGVVARQNRGQSQLHREPGCATRGNRQSGYPNRLYIKSVCRQTHKTRGRVGSSFRRSDGSIVRGRKRRDPRLGEIRDPRAGHCTACVVAAPTVLSTRRITRAGSHSVFQW